MKKLSVLIPVFNQEKLILKAIQSIPEREDIEVIVCDDGSTDNTVRVVENIPKVILLKNKENKGVGYTVNQLMDYASGEYIVLLGSDDYFYTEKCNEVIELFLYDSKKYDIVYFDLQINSGGIFKVTEDTKYHYCGSVKFIKRSFIGGIRCPEIRNGEDFIFFTRIMEKGPKEIFSGQVVKHYNFPRKGSLVYLASYGSE